MVVSELPYSGDAVASLFYVSRIVIYQKKAVIFKILNTEDWNLKEMPKMSNGSSKLPRKHL